MDEEIAAEIVGSDEADVPIPIASTNKSGRKLGMPKVLIPIPMYGSSSHVVMVSFIYVHIRGKPKARSGDPRPKRSKRKSTV